MKARYSLIIIALLAAVPGIAGALGADESLVTALGVLTTSIAGLLRSPVPDPKSLPRGNIDDLK